MSYKKRHVTEVSRSEAERIARAGEIFENLDLYRDKAEVSAAILPLTSHDTHEE